MNIQTIARTFGMTIDQFAKHTGYSRQAFYQKSIRNTAKSQQMIRDLKRLERSMFELDIEKAKDRSDARLRAIEELEKMCAGVGETDG